MLPRTDGCSIIIAATILRSACSTVIYSATRRLLYSSTEIQRIPIAPAVSMQCTSARHDIPNNASAATDHKSH